MPTNYEVKERKESRVKFVDHRQRGGQSTEQPGGRSEKLTPVNFFPHDEKNPDQDAFSETDFYQWIKQMLEKLLKRAA